ncbi:DNA-binding NarL/FixJ family response regulator [Kitasatospora sp. GP30]|uniref:LuxR C-terminal-related transcriptional regulator n=1 Tax=Kitasatospora sp. GP30 TaxID=3035084 RepID=UPI000C715993|nr:LuxR C-terminal-related transcriptional regulator [Kitasatospora sp. GP30]MDH6138488.1 DNA-binding NarL/FixJ family response regulator [Kitasatospora sp. GP30]
MTAPTVHPFPSAPELTEQQVRLLKWRAAGRTRTQIARATYTSEGRVTAYTAELQAALGASSRTQVIALGLIHQFLAPEDVITCPVVQPVHLSPRQLQVLRTYACGEGDPDAALELGVTYGTVRGYGSTLLQILRARDRPQAVALGLVYELLLLRDIDDRLPAIALHAHTGQPAAT